VPRPPIAAALLLFIDGWAGLPVPFGHIPTACSGVTMSLSPMVSKTGTLIAAMACEVISGSSIA
jgi:hypothetical protein